MFKEDAFVDRIMKFEIYDRVQTFELMLAMFIVCGVAVIVIDIIDEITKEKTDELRNKSIRNKRTDNTELY